MANNLTVSTITTDIVAGLKNNGIESLLPAHIKTETFARLAAVAIFNNPMLQDADQTSVINGLIMSAKDGLLCDGREAALVPFKTKVNGQFITKAQYMPMVDGVLKRVRQSGQVKDIDAKAVFENDTFDFWSDEDGDHFTHRPTLKEPGELIAVIAFAKMNDGSKHISLLRRWEIDRARETSKQGNNEFGPWVKFFDRMACKTGLHRIARRLPNSSEILEMLERGDPRTWTNDKHEEKDITPKSKSIGNNVTAEDIFSNNAGGAKPDKAQELIDQINECEDMSTLSEIGSYVSNHASDFSESELLSIKSAYQKIKTILEDS